MALLLTSGEFPPDHQRVVNVSSASPDGDVQCQRAPPHLSPTDRQTIGTVVFGPEFRVSFAPCSTVQIS